MTEYHRNRIETELLIRDGSGSGLVASGATPLAAPIKRSIP